MTETFIFSQLPDVIIQYIINYTDVVVYRNGKFINRLNKKKDMRFDVIRRIPRPISFTKNKYLILFESPNGMFLEYFIYPNNQTVTVSMHKKQIVGHQYISVSEKYVNSNQKWHKMIHYTM